MNMVLVLHKYGVRLDDPCCFPLGFMYISSVLKEQGHNVKVLNYNLWEYDLSTEIEGADAVLFTGFEEFLPYIQRDAAICREKGVKTILGGALATFRPRQMREIVDVVIDGEGETAFGGDMNSLPDYDGFGVREYHRRNGFKHMGVLTSRGCPHSCTFCSQTCRFSVRRLSHVFDEIDGYRAKYDPQCIVFNDNTLNISKLRFMAICDGMKSRGLMWTAAIRVDVFDEDMAKAAKDSGCRYFVVGIESFRQEKLDRMKKGITTEQIIRTLDILHKYGIDYHGNVLFGFEGEAYRSIVQEVLSIPQGYKVFPAMVQPFVGTNEGKKRDISPNQYAALNEKFKEYIASQGKYSYPELAA
jgi:anaerobic magnesium-protoporphyrin IX monomethyl ester cyclase